MYKYSLTCVWMTKQKLDWLISLSSFISLCISSSNNKNEFIFNTHAIWERFVSFVIFKHPMRLNALIVNHGHYSHSFSCSRSPFNANYYGSLWLEWVFSFWLFVRSVNTIWFYAYLNGLETIWYTGIGPMVCFVYHSMHAQWWDFVLKLVWATAMKLESNKAVLLLLISRMLSHIAHCAPINTLTP